jgi:hypothetical protein
MKETLTFRNLIQESLLDSVKAKFKDMIKAIQDLKEYTYEITINDMSVYKDKVRLISIPKKEADEVKKWVKILKDMSSKKVDKTPKISDLDAELKKAFKNGRTEI